MFFFLSQLVLKELGYNKMHNNTNQDLIYVLFPEGI